MPYDVILDPRQLAGTLDALANQQLPYATMRGLNDLGKAFQAAEREGIASRMTIRRPWVLQQVKIDRGDFATKEKLSVRVHIDQPGDFLDKFEPGGERTPIGSQALSIPEAARPAKAALIPNALRPRNLGFREISGAALATHAAQVRDRRLKQGILRGAFQIYEGDKRTFIIQSPGGRGLILQRVNASRGRTVRGVRVGPRDAGVIVLYVLRPRTSVPASLHFSETATATVMEQWPGLFMRAYLEALRTARPG